MLCTLIWFDLFMTGKHHSPNGGFVFQLETPVKLHSGKNYISLLSATIGLKVLIDSCLISSPFNFLIWNSQVS